MVNALQGLRELLAEHLWPALGITAEAQDALQPFIYFQQWWRTGRPPPACLKGPSAALFPFCCRSIYMASVSLGWSRRCCIHEVAAALICNTDNSQLS